jgi:hypothetical protein
LRELRDPAERRRARGAGQKKLRDLIDLVQEIYLACRLCFPEPETRPDSTALGDNLAVGRPDGETVPWSAVSSPRDEVAAHHIVAGTAADAREARDILRAFPVCIGINDAINGVWLPRSNRTPASDNPLGRVFHNQTQTPSYYRHVTQLLRPPSVRGDRDAVRAVLSQLRRELKAGTVSW